MAQQNNDTRYSPSTRHSPQIPQLTPTRGSYDDHPLSPVLHQTTRLVVHNHHDHSSTLHDHHAQHTAPHAQPHQINVLRTWGMGTESVSDVDPTLQNTVGWYRPGDDPPTQEDSAPSYYQQQQQPPPHWETTTATTSYAQHQQQQQTTNWVADVQQTPYHGMTSMVEYNHEGWDGQSSFQTPTGVSSPAYPIQLDLHSPNVDTQWPRFYYPPTASVPPPPTPTCSPNTDSCTPFITQVTNPSTPSPLLAAFVHFPQDPARDIAYAEHGSPVNEATNNELLGMKSRINSLENEDHRIRGPAQGQASTSIHGVHDNSPRPIQLSSNLSTHFPEPRLRELAEDILAQRWLDHDEDEPAVKPTDKVVRLKFFSGKKMPKSSFEPFFDEKLRCRVVEANGMRCDHKAARKDRAVGHARAHFAYRPFVCASQCGKVGCRERYTCASFRNDHVGRKKNPKRACLVCDKTFTAQNLQRHMKQHIVHSPQANHPSPSSQPADDRPSPKKRKISIFRSFVSK